MLNFNGNLKHAAERMYNKSMRAIFSLKAKIMNYDSINSKLLLKLFDCLIRSILAYVLKSGFVTSMSEKVFWINYRSKNCITKFASIYWCP